MEQVSKGQSRKGRQTNAIHAMLKQSLTLLKASPETRKRLSSMNQPLSKRQKTEEPKRSKFSSLLRKVSTPKTKAAPISKPPVSLAASSAGKTTGLSVAKAPPVETTRAPLQSKGTCTRLLQRRDELFPNVVAHDRTKTCEACEMG